QAGGAGLSGRIEARIFQGNHWLYQIGTEAGRVIVIRPNDGLSAPAEGADVVLTWRAEDAALRQRADA
ncbi:MAG: TOBE domain-containing protein, partial [Beijerinckiaceae bacterium]